MIYVVSNMLENLFKFFSTKVNDSTSDLLFFNKKNMRKNLWLLIYCHPPIRYDDIYWSTTPLKLGLTLFPNIWKNNYFKYPNLNPNDKYTQLCFWYGSVAIRLSLSWINKMKENNITLSENLKSNRKIVDTETSRSLTLHMTTHFVLNITHDHSLCP